jgi:hypothetical protein
MGFSGSYFDGGLTFLKSGGVDPLALNTAWNPIGTGLGYNMQFTANFSAVPEPEA